MSDAPHTEDHDWSLTEEVGGGERLRRIVSDFYERVFDDPIIGFLFDDEDFERLVDRQVEYVRARLGSEEVDYEGTPIRGAHESLPIQVGHFDRRTALLRETLDDYEVPDHVRDAWLALDASLRELVLQTGEEAREEILERDGEEGGSEPGQHGENDGED